MGKRVTVKAWAAISRHPYCSLPLKVAYPHRFDAEYAAQERGLGDRVVRCTITYTLPAKRKARR